MSLVELGWRQFTFFEKRSVMDPNDSKEKFKGLESLVACCSQSGDGFTLFGEPGGAIFKLSRKLREYCWIAHKRSLASISLAGSVLATVGEDEEGVNSLVKLWQLDRIEKEAPFCVRVVRACPLLGVTRCPRACAVAMHSSLQHFAIGFSDSSVLYHHGNILKEKPTKWLTVVDGVMSGTGDEVTGLAIAWLPSRNACVLYVMTCATVQSFVICNKVITATVMHDAKGCLRDCWSFSEESNRLVVGSAEMVHFYEADQSLVSDVDVGRGKCHALGRSNEKVQLIAFNNYVALLTRQPSAIPSSEEVWAFVLSIYDVEGQCVAFSCALPSVSQIFLLDSTIMVLSADGTLAHLVEKHIKTKLDVLFKKNLFDLAVGLAKRSAVGNEYLPDIYTKYGDYLFLSGDFENAVKQYIETIGSLEPSYVIKKFLDGSRIKELCAYLEMLHKKGKASAQHTTILLNCYTKLGARHKIDCFIKQKLSCDVDVAVQVLRGANFTTEACRLCEENGLHDALLSIYIDDCAEYATALAYIEKLQPDLIEKYLEKYGKLLLEMLPEATMNLLVKLIASNGEIDATHLMKMFVGDAAHCSRFVELALQADRGNSQLRDIVLELRLRQWLQRGEDSPDTSAQIVALIGNKDLDQALQICQMFDFAPGIVDIYTKLERFDELIEYHMRQNNLKEIFELCEMKGSRKLWIDAIIFASREENIDANALQYLLERVEETNSIHPLVVLEILSRSNKLCVANVRDYILRWLKHQNEQIASDEKSIAASEAKMTQVEEQIESINYKVQIFQMNKCSACDTSLQLPAVHFLCKHSYHAHCLESYSERADSCPAVHEHESDIFSSRSARKQFRDEMDAAVDCMSLIASYMGNGLFDSWSSAARSSNASGNPFERAVSVVEKPSNIGTNPFEMVSSVSSSTRSSSKTGVTVNPTKSTNPFDDEDDEPTSTNPFGNGF
ncbi:unnamed protein product [Toxocara canis]|uniref:Vacuolar protein sorting-associated protein 11 homolog n=1 Tax=Toxocara canis TaxID=6265 RepID=A0A183UHJ9_TOXCA|nr:unnamed protein product [Toxocara canis]